MVCIVGTLSPGVMSARRGDLGLLTFEYRQCPSFHAGHFDGGVLSFSLVSGPNVVSRSIRLRGSRWGKPSWSAYVRPGVYRYSVSAVSATPAGARLVCSDSGYVATLPGDSRVLKGGLQDGVDDAIAPLIIYGRRPRGANVKVFRLGASGVCRAHNGTSNALPLATTETPVGYYAADTFLSGRSRRLAKFLILIHMSRAARYVAVTGRYPYDLIGVPATDLRYDITQRVARQLPRVPLRAMVRSCGVAIP